MPQTWNNLLEYIKLELGVPVNLLEISDDDIIKYIKNHALPEFSQYVPAFKFKVITESNRVTYTAGPSYAYKIPADPDDQIIDIYDVYYSKSGSITADILSSNYILNTTDVIDTVIMNEFNDLVSSLRSRQTWEFAPPDILYFDKELPNGSALVVYNIVHKSLDTIRPDMYRYFKKYCAGYVKTWVAKFRSKFDNLATPVGQLSINWQQLLQEGQQDIQEVYQILETVPPDHLIVVESNY